MHIQYTVKIRWSTLCPLHATKFVQQGGNAGRNLENKAGACSTMLSVHTLCMCHEVFASAFIFCCCLAWVMVAVVLSAEWTKVLQVTRYCQATRNNLPACFGSFTGGIFQEILRGKHPGYTKTNLNWVLTGGDFTLRLSAKVQAL